MIVCELKVLVLGRRKFPTSTFSGWHWQISQSVCSPRQILPRKREWDDLLDHGVFE
jgi:hypothetical protein